MRSSVSCNWWPIVYCGSRASYPLWTSFIYHDVKLYGRKGEQEFVRMLEAQKATLDRRQQTATTDIILAEIQTDCTTYKSIFSPSLTSVLSLFQPSFSTVSLKWVFVRLDLCLPRWWFYHTILYHIPNTRVEHYRFQPWLIFAYSLLIIVSLTFTDHRHSRLLFGRWIPLVDIVSDLHHPCSPFSPSIFFLYRDEISRWADTNVLCPRSLRVYKTEMGRVLVDTHRIPETTIWVFCWLSFFVIFVLFSQTCPDINISTRYALHRNTQYSWTHI